MYPETEETANGISGRAAFTGHRELPEGSEEGIAKALLSEVEKLYENGVTEFLSGGAIGFDMLAGFAVLAVRRKHPEIKLVLALPCRDHTVKWNSKQKETFSRLFSSADEIIYVSDNYFNGCMLKRDRYMVDRAEYLVCYLTKDKGGTAYTVSYAEKLGRKIIRLAK